MSTIPLVALSAKQTEAPDILGSAGKAMSIANLAGQNAMQPGQLQAQQQNLALGQQNQQMNAINIQQKQKEIDDQAKIEKILTDSGSDFKSAIPKIMAVNPQLGIKYQTDIMKSDTADMNDKKAIIGYHNETAGRLAQLAGGVTDEPTFHNAIGQALSENLIDGPTAAKYLSQPFSLDEVKQIQQQALSAKDQLDLADKAITAKSTQERETRLEKTQAETSKPQDVRDYEYAQKQGYKGTFEQWKEKFKASALSPGSELSDAAINQASDRYSETGVMPAMGMGSAGVGLRSKIMNRAAERNPAGNIASNSAKFRADQQSLTGLQKNFDQFTAFENTAGKNLDLFLSTAKKLEDAGSPWVNKPWREVQSGLFGNADLAAFNAARATALTEISKVLNSSNASGVLSDSARSEVGELIGPNASIKQIESAAKILKADMANRNQSYQDQIQDIKGRLRGAQGGGQSQSGAPSQSTGHKIGDIVTQGGKNFKVTSVDQNGKVTAATAQ